MKRSELAKAIYELAHMEGEFVLSSKQKTNEYFDKYKFESHPTVLREVAKHIVRIMPHDTEAVAGIELGGIPLVTAVSLETGLPMALVRKQVKYYATSSMLEGADVAGKRVCLIEDIITTGHQTIDGRKKLTEHGALGKTTICVLLRADGAQANFQKAGLNLQPLFTVEALRSYQ